MKYWQQEHFQKIKIAKSYKDLLIIAKDILKNMPSPVAQVCGPISTGGAGSIEKNIKRLEDEIISLQKQGIEIFNQTPFDIPMQRIKISRKNANLDDTLLKDFYLPIFESKLINKLYFLPDWESSLGAKWEHEQALRLGLDIEYIK